jgi:hypothetical protein
MYVPSKYVDKLVCKKTTLSANSLDSA